MPQPLSRVTSNASVYLSNSGDYLFNTKPELAIGAMTVISAWSTLESFLSGVLIRMLGPKAPPAIAMFSSLTSASAKRTAVRAAAKTVLEDKVYTEFATILEMIKTAAKDRNKIAHWIWGHSPQIPDGLLLCHPETMTEFQLAIEKYTSSILEGPLEQKFPPDFPRDKVFVYKVRDFEIAISAIESATNHLANFRFLLPMLPP